MFRKTLMALGAAAALTFIPTAAYALDCTNASRPAYAGSDWTEVPGPEGAIIHIHATGNWVYVQEFGAWTFIPPGTIPLTPGANGNFENGQGFALTYNAHCDSKGAVLLNRQTDHGIQLMDGCLEAP
ncbi:hypothetical protein [Sinomonas flava]|uniref:hypothetical protein n=1 Tax=Sinomonas flava TaxID=496857 RepID=UPI0039A57ED6